MLESRFMRAIALGVLVLLTAGLSSATPIVFQGNFAYDDDIQEFLITVGGAGTITAQTYSYLGATLDASTTIAGGGFGAVLTLFDPFGAYVAMASGGNPDEASLSLPVYTAGQYILALTQLLNVPVGPFLSDGFMLSGQPTYTGTSYLSPPATGMFIDFDRTQRTSAWAVGINYTQDGSNADFDAQPIPEPGPLMPAAIGLVLLLVSRRRVVRPQV